MGAETGRLCVAGDWACIHGDLIALSYVARQIAETAAPPLHDELARLAQRCVDPHRATAAWTRIKELAQAPS
jgi:hypothetical protein